MIDAARDYRRNVIQYVRDIDLFWLEVFERAREGKVLAQDGFHAGDFAVHHRQAIVGAFTLRRTIDQLHQALDRRQWVLQFVGDLRAHGAQATSLRLRIADPALAQIFDGHGGSRRGDR